jgi:hypothetical protein
MNLDIRLEGINHAGFRMLGLIYVKVKVARWWIILTLSFDSTYGKEKR